MTVPPASAVAPARVAESVMVASAVCGETVTSVVVMVGLLGVMVIGSLVQTLAAAVLLVSPEYTACQK